jgi:hypothetical protein
LVLESFEDDVVGGAEVERRGVFAKGKVVGEVPESGAKFRRKGEPIYKTPRSQIK